MNETEIITTREDLIKLIKGGNIFEFCVAFALNKGFRDVIKNKEEFKTSIGDYDVTFDKEKMCFILINKKYFFRIIHVYFDEAIFTGYSVKGNINDLLTELNKEV